MTRAQRTSAGLSVGIIFLLGIGYLVLQSMHVGAQDSPGLNGLSFEQLQANVKNLAESGFDRKAQGMVFADWMKENDWQAISIQEQRQLLDGIDADRIDFPKVSVRWSGYIEAPTSGEFVFHQMRQHGDEPVMKVWVNNDLVLDSSVGTEEWTDSYRSQSVNLVSGQRQPIRVEFFHHIDHEVENSKGAPMAVLAWESKDTGNRKLIPPTAFSPPSGVEGGSGTGLVGEYFSGSGFEADNLVKTRRDASIDHVWPWRPIIPLYETEWNSLVEACGSKVLHGPYLAQVATSNAVPFLDEALWQLSHRLSLTQRLALVQKIRENQKLLQSMKPYAMAKLMESIYMLPGKEHLDLLVAWSLAKPQPKTALGIYPGWGDEYYRSLNSDYYWLIGQFLQRNYFGDVAQLWERDIRRPDGECNLAIAYSTVFAAKASGKGRELLDVIKESVDDNALNGDQKMTWLLALAFAEEALVSGEPRPMRGIAHLQQAMLVATGKDKRFWALQEMVARYASMDQESKANELIDQYAAEFSGPNESAVLGQWRIRARELAGHYVDVRKIVDYEPLRQYIGLIETRLETAQAKNADTDVAKFQQLLAAARSGLPQE